MTYKTNFEESIQQIILERIQFEFQHCLDKNLLNIPFRVETYQSIGKRFSDEIFFKLKMGILGEKQKVKIEIPKSWFQMFKKERFPKWLLKKFPVKNNVLGTMELYQLYPHIKAKIPEERHYIHFHRFDLNNVH